MDVSLFIKEPDKKAKSLVRKLTHSGETTDLNKDDLKELKQLCQNSKDDFIIIVYRECMKCLHKSHSQVRVATVKLLDYFFQKSHIFRQKLLDDFDIFLELALAITQRPKIKLQLPPPKKYAILLQELSAKMIYKWHADFGTGYEKLRYADRHLREHKLVDFSRFRVNNHEQLIKQQKLAERQERVLTRSIENRLGELRALKPEIEQILAQIESLIDILVPDSDVIGGGVESEEDLGNPASSSNLQHHGIASLSQTIEIEFSPYVEVKKNQDNKDIVHSLKELKKELIDSKLVKLIAIEKTLSKRSEQLVNTLKEIIDLKTRSTNIVLKLGELKIINDSGREKSSGDMSGDSDEDDYDDNDSDDFQEVQPKDDLETYIPKSMRYEYGLEPIDPRELMDKNQNNITQLTDESFESPSTSSAARKRDTIEFILPCNVRLETGKLCPRRDKIKCPFHGKIIPRDHNGVPLDEEVRREEEERAKRQASSVPDWQDPELLADIRAATGVDLTMPARRNGKLSKGSPNKNLANPKTCDVTPKQRLQKRLKMLVK